MFTPHVISMVSVATLFLWMMDSKNGLFNTVLQALGENDSAQVYLNMAKRLEQ